MVLFVCPKISSLLFSAKSDLKAKNERELAVELAKKESEIADMKSKIENAEVLLIPKDVMKIEDEDDAKKILEFMD